jgi:hypothetical protein
MSAFREGQYPIDSFIMDYDWWKVSTIHSYIHHALVHHGL